MNLHDHLARELDTAQRHPAARIDVERLGQVARTQGTRALRRRRTGAVLGSVALVAAIGLGTASLTGGADGSDAPRFADSGAADPTPTASPTPPAFDPAHPGDAGPTTPRGLAAALGWAVADEQSGTATDYRAQGGSEWYAELRWDAADGRGSSMVGINVQPGTRHFSCGHAYMLDCHDDLLPDGAQVTTYEEHTTVAAGTGIARVAELKRPDGVRVVVSATNGRDLPGNQWDITRPQPPLTAEQLTTIADQAFWGTTLPTHFLDAGRGLSPYEDIDSGF